MSIAFDGSPMTAAPPATLGPYLMIPFPPDNRPLGDAVSGVPTPIGGAVTFTVPGTLLHYEVPTDPYTAWSHGYMGDIYATDGPMFSITFTLPANTGAFYFYMEPGVEGPIQFTATAQTGTTSGIVEITGDGIGGAKYFGFYSTDNTTPILSITITAGGGMDPFAIGEFGIASLSGIICLHPDTLVLTNKGHKRIAELRMKEIVIGKDGEKIPIIHNTSFPPTKNFVKIPKSSIAENIPSQDLIIRKGHPVLIDGKEILPQRIPNSEIIKLQDPVSVYTLCTKRRTFAMMNNLPVCTWGINQFNRCIQKNKFISFHKQ